MGATDLGSMHEAMISHWRQTVAVHQTVLHIGDHITAPPHRHAGIADRLTGQIILVRGNHDGPTRGVLATHDAVRFLLPDGRQVLAIHDPADADGLAMPSDTIIMHGHLHGHPPPRPLPAGIANRCIDCSMDALRELAPVPLSMVVDRSTR